ncbi:hypothetical protein [Amnibacterium kyonggiense]|nr:hypothetical protein [Amnibacterium kyonggiense]
MTALTFTPDESSYSIRACRCGRPMTLGRDAAATVNSWRCRSCDRSARV